MRSTAPRRAEALLLAGAIVLLLAAPAAAAPARPAAQSSVGPSLFQAVAAWLAAWLPGAQIGPTLTAAPAPLGAEPDPNGAKAATSSDGPVATPQLGADIDPSG